MTHTLYGIPNCDSCRKAKNWLTNANIPFNFYDIRKQGLETALIQSWIEQVGLEQLINKRSTTWRQLDASLKQNLNSQTAVAMIVDYPTLIKRPILVGNDSVRIGFKPEWYTSWLRP